MNDAVKPTRAAIEAFHEAYDASIEINPRETSQAIYDGLVAALAAQGQPVAVKALEWSRQITSYGHILKAYDPFCRQAYSIRVEDSTTPEEIADRKAAAQSDYASRILSQVITAPAQPETASDEWLNDGPLTPEEAWTILCEMPDITSPEEYPDHALITMEQLAGFMQRAAPAQPVSVPQGKISLGWMPSYGRCSANDMLKAVTEAIYGDRDYSILRNIDNDRPIGHQMVPTINFNSLNRIISAFADPQPPAEGGWKPTHRHKKRGSPYTLIGIGKMQAENWIYEQELKPGHFEVRSTDMHEVAIYRSVDDGSLWVRPREEFEDGRFEEVGEGGQ